MNEREVHAAVEAGYELGAQTPEEAAGFAEIAATLGSATRPVEPPPALKASIMAKLASTPQLPAVDAPDGAAPTAAPDLQQATAAGPVETRARSRWFRRPAVILTAAAAAVVLFFGGLAIGTAIGGNASNSVPAQQASALAQLNAASDVQRATSTVSTGGSATLVWSSELGTSAIVVRNLSPVPVGKTYQLWYVSDGKTTSAGTIEAVANGPTWAVLSGTMSAGSTVAMTIEPAGGSPQPTTRPVVAIPSS